MVGSKKNLTFRYIIAFALLIVMVFPYLYMVMNSFADWTQVDKKMVPTDFTLRSYEWLFSGGEAGVARPWLHAFLNSVIVSTISTGLMMATGAMVAFALAKMNFRGRNFINNAVLFQMFFPAIILLIPTFLIVQNAGLYDTYMAMILPKH